MYSTHWTSDAIVHLLMLRTGTVRIRYDINRSVVISDRIILIPTIPTATSQQ